MRRAHHGPLYTRTILVGSLAVALMRSGFA